jgi:glycosyltransferase involved in cell wall biosynthesis
MATSYRAQTAPLPGGRVVFLSPTFAPYTVPVFDLLYQLIGEGFTVVTLRHPRLEIDRVALGMGTFPRLLIDGRSMRISRLDDEGQETPICFLWSPSLPLVLASLKPEVVITRNFNTWTLIPLLMRYPTVIFWEGTQHTERTVGPWRLRLRRWIGRRAAAFVVNGALAHRYLVETIRVPADRIVEGGMCAEPVPDHIRRGPRARSNGDPLIYLFIGQMIGRKGVPHLLRAAHLLKARSGANAHFTILLLGDGPERQQYEALACRMGIHDQVRFLGHIPPGQIWHWYEQADVFVLPTLQDNWPLVVPEAMSMGLPVLLSKYAGAVPDLIREGDNGYSFDPQDHEDLASRLEEYLRNPQLVRKHGECSLKLVSRYNPVRAADAILCAVGKAKSGSALSSRSRNSAQPSR